MWRPRRLSNKEITHPAQRPASVAHRQFMLRRNLRKGEHVRGGGPPMHGFDNLNIRFTSKLWVSAHFQAARSRRRRLPEWVQKWVRFNESLLNIKNKMASLSLIFPLGIGYNAGDWMSFGREPPSARKSSISGPVKLR